MLSSSSESDDDLDEDEYIVEKILDFKEERDKKVRFIIDFLSILDWNSFRVV